MQRRRWTLGLAALATLGAGCSNVASPLGAPVAAPSAVPAGASGALAALESALRSYEQEDLKPLEALLSTGFVGRSLLLDAALTTLNEQKQLRITLGAPRWQQSPNAAVVQLSARWDKRFLKLPGLVPTAETGVVQAFMRLEGGQWQIESLSADNPFSR